MRPSRVVPALSALLYALLALPLALVSFVLLLAALALAVALSVTAIGPWLLGLVVRGALALGAVQRALARRLIGLHIEPPPRRRPALRDRAGWRAVGCALLAPATALVPFATAFFGYAYGVLFLLHPLLKRWNYHTERDPETGAVRHISLQIAGVQLDSWPRWLAVVLAGAVLLAGSPWLLRHALAPHRMLLRALLGPSAAERRIRALEETRAHAVDDAATTLRRIERDLHDGTQARLVGLGMQLTMLQELLAADAGRDRLGTVVSQAQDNAKHAVAELRDLVRGIHPPVLDQGLATALRTLAADTALPVTVTVELPRRPAPAVESLVYFCAAELLGNVLKHSGATAAQVELRAEDGVLRLAVRDDGRGGAAVGAGSGLRGLLDRARTMDATLTCDSPPGGPTVVTVTLPFRS
ncbi:sensor histidine kinase [Streptomyces boncukensis]|uniref:histidine kinase n=1 Tax=Streptomyces boncukensis TaxID=2711219 RepID=A0A6G4WZL6_9ACTN|nr:sensor domain-containing protein [Streptomyces boncukensis]NGO70312.1 sensor histidine kinase [Streptomyces boncukensis]